MSEKMSEYLSSLGNLIIEKGLSQITLDGILNYSQLAFAFYLAHWIDIWFLSMISCQVALGMIKRLDENWRLTKKLFGKSPLDTWLTISTPFLPVVNTLVFPYFLGRLLVDIRTAAARMNWVVKYFTLEALTSLRRLIPAGEEEEREEWDQIRNCVETFRSNILPLLLTYRRRKIEEINRVSHLLRAYRGVKPNHLPPLARESNEQLIRYASEQLLPEYLHLSSDLRALASGIHDRAKTFQSMLVTYRTSIELDNQPLRRQVVHDCLIFFQRDWFDYYSIRYR